MGRFEFDPERQAYFPVEYLRKQQDEEEARQQAGGGSGSLDQTIVGDFPEFTHMENSSTTTVSRTLNNFYHRRSVWYSYTVAAAKRQRRLVVW